MKVQLPVKKPAAIPSKPKPRPTPNVKLGS